MNRDTANKIIHEQIMNECWHDWEYVGLSAILTARWVCSKCNANHESYTPKQPNYCNDANQAVLVMGKCDIFDVIKPTGNCQWIATYQTGTELSCAEASTFCLAICTAALGILRIAEQIR